jgi:hypothetical protein
MQRCDCRWALVPITLFALAAKVLYIQVWRAVCARSHCADMYSHRHTPQMNEDVRRSLIDDRLPHDAERAKQLSMLEAAAALMRRCV